MPPPLLHLAVALDGAGWHPAAWREPTARPTELSTAGYWTDLVLEAEAGLLDLVTLEDALRLQTTDRTDLVTGRLDAVLVAARLALVTERIGLVPSATATHTEPFHLSKAVATLDHATRGRAGVRVQVSLDPREAAHVGRRPELLATAPGAEPDRALVEDVVAEGCDWVEVLRRLWDSWEDDAEVRDVATGRFVDVTKLHHVDVAARHFSVRGPSITPRPPQGQPLVVASATAGPAPLAHRLLARCADLGLLTPHDDDGVRRLVAAVRAEREAQPAWPDGLGDQPLRLLGDVVVALDERPGAAAARLARLDEAAGAPLAASSDALVFAGTPAELADLALAWQEAGLDGLRLRPAVLPDDLRAVTRALVPELQRRGAFRTAHAETTLRARLGLRRPANRYAREQVR